MGGAYTNNNNSYASQRDYFLKRILDAASSKYGWRADLDYPENFKDWLEYSGYNDLLEFEHDACHLARGIILFAESPGSLAELGAFSVDSALVKSMVVVTEEQYLQQGSFLELGPLKRIGAHDGLCVIGKQPNKHLTDDDFELVSDFITYWLPRQQKTQKFDSTIRSHQLLLLADLVDLLIVSKLNEIQSCIEYFQVEMSPDRLEKSLALLNFLSMIRTRKRGNQLFYTRRSDSDAPWIDYSGRSSRFERTGFKLTTQQLVEDDSKKKSILRSPQ